MKKMGRKLILSISLCVGVLVIASGQNPFDIKTPGKKENTANTKTPAVPQKKQPETKPAEPLKPALNENKNVPPSTTLPSGNQAATQNASSGNPFEKKAGTSAQAADPAINTSIQAEGNKSSADQPVNPVPQDVKPTTPPTLTNGSNNPFNIKAGTDPNRPVNSQSSTTPVIAAPDIKDIKNQIDEFKDSTVKRESNISKNTWFVIYIFLVLLAGIAINFNRSYPLALMRATYNQNQMRILFKDAFKGNHTFIFGILYFLFIVNAGIFLYQSFLIFDIARISLVFAIFIVFITYLVRHLVLFVMGVIFPMTKETSLFSYIIGIYNLALGIALLFLNSALLFVDPETGKMLIFSGLSIIIVLYLLRQIRGLLNSGPSIISAKFHFIIYLCTVEIAPWLLLSGILLK